MQLITYSLELAQPKESKRLSRHESRRLAQALDDARARQWYDQVVFDASRG